MGPIHSVPNGMKYLRHGLITEEIPEPPTNKKLILIFHYQSNQVVATKSEEITNISSKYSTKCKSIL